MIDAEKIYGCITQNRKNEAINLITDFYNDSKSKKYADAYLSIVLYDVVQKLNQTVSGFYIDRPDAENMVFNDFVQMPLKEIIDCLCKRLIEAQAVNYEITYNKALAVIEEEYSDINLCVGSLARRLGLSDAGFSKLFRKYSGISPSEYITALRIKNSIALLTQTDRTISDIAKLSGFYSVEVYIRNFKKINKTTPGAYRLESSAGISLQTIN